MTPKQASQALSALTNLEMAVVLYAEISNIPHRPFVWQQEALFRLRAHLIAMLPDGDPQLFVTPPETDG